MPRVRRAGLFPVLLVALVSPAGQAHYDGTPMELNPSRHSYYWASVTTQRDKDPQVACEQYCTVTQSRQYYQHFFDSGTDQWKCQCTAASPPGAPGTTYTATAGNERHCNYGEAFSSETGGACSAGGPSNCRARQGEYISYRGFTNPPGFNLPASAGDIPSGGVLAGLQNCSLKRISSSVVGGCWNLTYSITGSGPVDEDGQPVALDDGSAWPTGVPSVCDPEEAEDPDAWSDGGGGSGGGVIPTEETPEIDDPLLEGTGQLEEDTDSWLDILTEPIEWTEDVFAGWGPDFASWNILPATCGGSVVLDIPGGWGGPAGISFSCEDTQQIRDVLGIAVALLFGFWLIQTILTMPKTGG